MENKENIFEEMHENFDEQFKEIDEKEQFEMFSVYMKNDGSGIDIALPEHIIFLLGNDKTGKLQDNFKEAFSHIKTTVDLFAKAINGAVKEQGLISQDAEEMK